MGMPWTTTALVFLVGSPIAGAIVNMETVNFVGAGAEWCVYADWSRAAGCTMSHVIERTKRTGTYLTKAERR